MAFMSVEEWRKKKEAGNTQGASKSSSSTRSSAASPSSDVASYNSSGYMSVEEWRAKRTNKTAQGWADAASALLNDTQMYYSKWRKKDDPQYSDFQNRISDLLVQADGWRKQYSGDDEAISSIDYIVSALSEAKQYAFKNQEYYSQWDTEDDYNEYIAGMEEYEAKKNLDLGAAEKEIAELEAAFDDWMYGENAEDYDATDTNARKAYDQKVREWEKRIAQKKQFYNQAKYIQEGIALSGVADPNSEHYDRDFKNYTGYKSTEPDSVWDKLLHGEDAEYEYINNQNGYRNQLKQRHRSMSRGKAISDAETAFKERGLDRMTEDEIAIYNYYYAKEGKEKAQEYLSSIQETLNQRRAISVFKGVEDETFQEMVFGVEAGLDQFKSGISSLLNTEDAYIPQSAVQMASAMVREDLADAGPKLPGWMGGASLGQAGYDLVTTTSNMAPSTMTSLAVSMVNPTAGAAVGAVLMGGSAAGNAYQEALNAGYDKGQARAYSALVGGSEAGLQYLLGGISKLGGNLSGKAISKIMNGVDNAFARTAIQIAGNMASEGFEEGLQEVLTPWFKNLTLYTDEDINWTEVAYSSLLGALTAGFMEGPSTVSTELNTYRTGKRLQRENITAQRLADIGKTLSADTVAYQLAGRVNENTGAYTLGRLFNEIGAEITERNIADIQKSLERKRVARKDAKAIARSFAEVVAGAEFTDMQKAAIEMNNVLSQTVQEVIINPNSTVNQRSNGYKEVLMALAKEKTSGNTSRTSEEAPGQKSADTEGNLPGADKGASYEVSEDGKTHLVSDLSKDVTVKGIASIEDGKMILQLEDGSSVAAEDVSFGSEEEALVYATVAGMGVSLDTANSLVQAFDPDKGISASLYALDIKEAYNFGQYNYPLKATENDPYASEKKQAWNDGRIAAIKSFNYDQSAVEARYQQAKKILQETGKEVGGDYHAILEDGITALSLNESQKASYTLADRIAQGAKVNIRVYDGKTGEQGYYNPKTDEVYLNLNATNKSRKSMMAFVLGHEMVHRAKNGSPAKYQVFADFLMEQYGKQGSSVEEMIAQELAAAKEYGLEMSREQALEEVVADACQRMLLDTDAGKKLAEFGAESKQNRSFLEDLKRWIKEFMDNLRSMFRDVDPDSIAAKEFAKFDENVKQILADMYVDMTIDAGEHLSTIKTAFGKGTVVETNEAGEFTMAQSADGSEKVFNLVTWKNGGRETLEATLLREGYTEDEVRAALTIMDGKQELVEKIANEVDGDGEMAFPEQGRINEATLTTDIKDGHSVLSALVSNGDYPVNIDLLMVCKKRKAYQRVINRLCETGMIQKATVDALAIAEINKILGKYGFETACLGCFVESRRLRIQEWAQTIVKEWNGEVKKRNPQAKAFGFGKGEAKLTSDEIMQLIGELESGGEKNDKGNLNLGQGSAVKRIGVLLDKVPSLRKTLTIEDLITPDGLSTLRQFDSNLFSMVKSRYGINSPKFVQEFNPYNHELAMYGKVPQQYKSLREYLYAIGGARMQSFSDFIIENWFDYCQIVADFSARKLPMHTYTKEITLAKLFGMTGIKINMSLIPDVDRSLGKEYAGLTRNAKGELELIWADKDRYKATGGKSYMQSINFADAVALQNDSRYSGNVGTIAVGISDMHIRMMLNDSRIRMVIPYHSSGMNPIFADMMGTSYYKDYTNVQNTTVKQMYNSKGKPVTVKLTKPQTAQLTGGFQFNEVLQNLGDARAAADAYKEWCADASKHTITIKGETYTAELTPKFNDFTGEANYYKLLEDFNPYDCITEASAPQGDVQQIYPEGFEDILRAELSGQEKYRQKQEKNQAFDKAMGEIESYLETHTKADTVHYANQHGIKLGAKDKKLDAAGKERLKQLQQEGASFMLPKMGDKKPPETLSKQDLRDLLEKASSGEMSETTYFPVRINTPEILLDFIKRIEEYKGVSGKEYERMTADHPMAIPVKKARQAIAIASEWYGEGDAHEFAIDDVINIIEKMDHPRYLVYEDSTSRYVEIVNYVSSNGTKAIAVVEIDEYKGEQHMNGYNSGRYSTLVTLFPPDGKDRVSALLKNKNNIVFDVEKKKGNPQVTSGIRVPSVLTKLPFAPTVPQENAGVKNDSGRQNKLPVGEDTSPRALLANAFEGVAQNDIERRNLKQYQERVEQLNAEEDKLQELRAEIKELSFAKGKRDTKRITELQFEANATANRISTLDKMLLRFEASAPLQNILKREKEMVRRLERQRAKENLEAYRNKAEVKQSEILREYRATREALTQQQRDTTIMEKEFVRLVKAYEKQAKQSERASVKSDQDRATIADLKAALKEEAKKHRDDQKIWEREFNMLLREYESSGRKIDFLEQKIQAQRDSAKRKVNNRKRTEMRQKIRKVIRELDKLLNHGDKKRNVKEGMKDFVAEALHSAEILFIDNYTNEDMVWDGVGTDLTPAEAKHLEEARAIMEQIDNLPSGSYESWMERQEAEQKLKSKLAYRMAQLKDVFVRERERLNRAQVSDVLSKLAEAYKALESAEQASVRDGFHENVYQFLQMLQSEVGGTIVKDMSLGQLESLYKAYTMVLTTVRNANRMFAENLKETRDALANRVMFEIKKSHGDIKKMTKGGKLLNSFSWNNLKPVYAFQRIGSKTMTTLFGNIRKGQDTWARDIQEADEFRRKINKKYDRKSWDMEKTYSFESASGIRFDLTLEQIMSLYAYSKREQAHEHLLKGGFVFDGNTEVVETKNGIKRTYLMEDATAHNVSVEILADIVGKLTDQQKAYVDEMQDYLSTTMGNKGNDVSMELYGVKLFNEQFYFPLKSAGQYMERAKEANLKQEQGQINIVNSGFSKATTPKASNPVVLSGFMDVWASHVNEMSMYHSFVLPMEDFRRVYNYSSPNMEGQPSVSVNQVIQNAHGAAATAYIDQLYRDLNGGAVSDPRETAFKTMVGKFKKAAVFASASVVIQQPSAVGRAFALINPKYFIGPRVDAKRHKLLWQEVKTYAPVAFIKEMGYFDTGVGRSAVDFLKAEEYSGLKEKAKAMVSDADFRDEFIGKAPAMADELTWAAIWEAVKRETADKHPDMDVKSEEFLQTAGDRFSEVIDKTQVYDSVLARSANMRSKSLFMNMATSFMAEPTTSINMIEDAVRMGKQGNKKAAAKTIAAVYTSVLINSALVSLVYAARDDDEDETFLEKYYSSLATEILEGMNLITYYPLLKDVWSLLQGWDIERADMSIIADLVGGFEELVKAYSEDTAGMTNKQREQHEKNIVQGWWGTLESFASLLGLPLKNIRRDVNGARNLFSTIRTDMAGRNTTLSSLMDVVWGDIKDSVPVLGWMPSATKGDKLYGALARGEEIYAERLMSGYKNQDAANAAVRTAIKNRYLAGDIDSSTALKDLFLYAGVDAGDALWMVEEWDYKVANDGEYKKYGEFFDAVESGQNLDAVIKKYTDNGVDMDTLRGQITTHFRPLYVEMSASQKANIKDYIVHAYEQCGVRRSDAEDKLHDWDIEAQYGYGYGELDDAYRSGELSREEFRQAMIDNGTFPEKADRAIATYDWMRDNAEYGLEYSDAQKYAHPIDNYGYSLEDVGLDPYVYLDYKERKRDCLGTDDDNDGKADNGTLRADIFEMIDSLPINNNQKDALAAISYSMKSINKYAPWH